MDISSVSSSAANSYTSAGGSDEITVLEKQKSSLEKELQSVSQSKDDAKTKELKTSQLQLQIERIEARIQQIKTQKSKESQKRWNEKSSGKAANSVKLDVKV